MGAFASLEQFDDTFTIPTGRRLDGEQIPDGLYEVEIGKAELSETEKSRETILKVPLTFTSGAIVGDYTEKPYFFRSHEQMEKIMGDLKVMGFDVQTWNKEHGKKISEELPKAVDRMPGIKLKVSKSSRKDGQGKMWHNLHIMERVGPPPGEAPPASANGQAAYDPSNPF